MFYRFLIFIAVFNTYSVASEYRGYYGEKTFAISSSLAISKYHYLHYCGRDRFYPISYCIQNKAKLTYAGKLSYHTSSIQYFKNKWFSYISKYKGLSQTIMLIDKKFKDIFQRLHKAHEHKRKLENKFSEYKENLSNYNKYIREIDSDIKLLSSHGMNLAKVTKRLFITIKPQIIDAEMRMDTLSARQDTMRGLRSFEREMNRVSKLPQGAIDNSIQEIVSSIDTAITNLERALAQ